MLTSLGIIILGFLQGIECDRSLSLGLLKDTRSNAAFLPYTPEQRTFVAEKASKMFEIYVNRESKIINYGNEYKDIDPIPRIKSIASKAAAMSDAEFHLVMSNLFLSLRDKHTNYNIPGPHSCFFALSGVFFEFVESKNILKHPKLVVDRFMSFTELIDKYIDQFEQISKGDILLTIDGKSFTEYYQENKWLSGGANEYGGMRTVNYFMSVRSGQSNMLPKEDHVTFELHSISRKSTYNVTIPWFSAVNNECYQKTSDLYTQVSGKELPPLPVTKHLKAPANFDAFNPTSLKGRTDFSSILFPHLVEAVYPKDFSSGPIMKPTPDPTVSWSIYKRNGFKLGIILLKDFMPLNLDALSVIFLIRGLLVNELKHTDALVFDIRGNGGGLITMADFIPQFFIKGFISPGFRALVSQVNRNIFNNRTFYAPDDDWVRAIEQSGLRDMYTTLVKMDSDESANFLGTVYHKPVGVFNNANCYSACDLFSESMQDSGAAIIFGEDGTTGAGGANVIEYGEFLSVVDTIDFQPLPFPDNSGFRIGWRQQVRNGKNAGKIIEDIGVIPDHIIRPRITDITSITRRSTQFDRIADILKESGRKTGREDVYFESEPLFSEQPTGAYISFPIFVSGLDRFNILDKNGAIVGNKTLDMTLKEIKSYALESFKTVKKTGFEEFIIQGFRKDQEIVYTHRFVRFIPSMKHFFKLTSTQEFNLDLSKRINKMPCLVVYNQGTRDEDGWNIPRESRTLLLGNGTLYENNVDSTFSIFLKGDFTRKKVSLSIKGTLDSEPDCDFFAIQYVDADGSLDTVIATSGKVDLDQEYTLSNLGETTEIRLVFKSDPYLTMKGVSIESLSVRLL